MKWQAAALILSLMVPLVGAGTAINPELTDPAGDSAQVIDCVPPSCLDGVYSANPAAADQVDILAAWFTVDGELLNISLQTAAQQDDSVLTAIEFDVESTPFSDGANLTRNTVNLEAQGTTPTTGTNATWMRNGTVLTVSVPMKDVGVYAGDRLVNLRASTSRTESSTQSLGAGTQQDSDVAGGDARPFYMPVAAGELNFTAEALNGTYELGGLVRTFEGTNPWFSETPTNLTFNYRVVSHEPGMNLTVSDNGGEARNVTTDENGVALLDAPVNLTALEGREYSIVVGFGGQTTSLSWLLGGHGFDPIYAVPLTITGLGGNWTTGNVTTNFTDSLPLTAGGPENVTLSFQIHNNGPLANLTVEFVGYNQTMDVEVAQYTNETFAWTFQPMLNTTGLDVVVSNANGDNATYTLAFIEPITDKDGDKDTGSLIPTGAFKSPVLWVFAGVGILLVVVIVVMTSRR